MSVSAVAKRVGIWLGLPVVLVHVLDVVGGGLVGRIEDVLVWI